MDEAHMQRAIDLARRSLTEGGGPFGAVVVRAGELVASGRNLVVPSRDPTAHAEIEAVRGACRRLGTHDLSGCEIYTSCEPCPMCLGAIYWARLARIHYACTRRDAAAIGFDDESLYEELAREPAARKLPLHQMLRDEALEVFRAWDATPDRVMY